ncbi:MAG TPA: glycosyltransferase, partial [Candidatus Saccharimonadia bacterium]
PYIVGLAWHLIWQRYDLVYIYKPTPLTVMGLITKLLRRTTIVADYDDLGSEVMKIEGQPAPIWKLTAWCERVVERHADGVVVASRLLEHETQERYPTKPVIRLSNGVDPERFTPNQTPPRQTPHIIFFGVLNRLSITKPLLQALALVKAALPATTPLMLDIIGDGTVRPQLEQLATELGIKQQVTFWGWSSYDQFRQRVQTNDIAITTMPHDRTTAACSNQKVFQYQAMQLAVIGSRVGDMPDYLQDGQAGLIVPPNNAAELSQAILELMNHSDRRAQLAATGRKLAETTYSWKQLGGQLNQFLEELAHS